MKFTIEGFSQKHLIKYNLDIIDAAILRYFIDFKSTGKMVSRIIDDKQFYWIRYEAILEALPILKLNKPDSVYRRLKNMAALDILESRTIKQGGVYSYYNTGIKYLELIDDTAVSSDINPNKSDENPNLSDTNPNESDANPERNILLLYSSINNSSINNTYIEIIDYLNQKLGTKYDYKSKSTQNLIRSRVQEGHSIEDFKTVIDKKYKEWHGTDLEKYLRPITLFSASKFESYLNQQVNVKANKSTFHNFEQRTYNFDELEKDLLSNSDSEEFTGGVDLSALRS